MAIVKRIPLAAILVIQCLIDTKRKIHDLGEASIQRAPFRVVPTWLLNLHEESFVKQFRD